jgi:hypothetical protein
MGIPLEFEATRLSLHRRAGATILHFGRAQRSLLAETLRDIANLAAAEMIFGQFVGGQVFSTWTAVGGAGVGSPWWRWLSGSPGDRAMTQNTWNVFIMLGGIMLLP